MFDTVIKNVKIVYSDRIEEGNIGIEQGEIAKISAVEEELVGKKYIEGNQNYLFPGIIDNHVHLNDPGYTWREDFIHGTKAAAIGGVTTIVDMPMQNEPALSNKEIFNKKEDIVSKKAVIDYSFWGALVDYNLSELESLRSCGVTAFKSFLSPVGNDYTSLKNGQIREALKILKKFNGLAGFHCEDYEIIAYEQAKALKEGRVTIKDYLEARPLVAELIAVRNIIELATEQDARVHICHISHDNIAQAIKDAKDQGVNITAETCFHYLVFSEEDFIEKGMAYKCAPPLREKDNIEKLWKSIEEGIIDCIVSDHSPSACWEKDETKNAFEAWGGISGLQTGLQVMFNEGVVKRGLSPTFIARTMAKNPAKIFGLSSRKGEIKLGYDADFVLVDPEKEWEITPDSLAYVNQFSAFCGLKGKGSPIYTMVRGEIVASDGKVVAKPGYGELIRV